MSANQASTIALLLVKIRRCALHKLLEPAPLLQCHRAHQEPSRLLLPPSHQLGDLPKPKEQYHLQCRHSRPQVSKVMMDMILIVTLLQLRRLARRLQLPSKLLKLLQYLLQFLPILPAYHRQPTTMKRRRGRRGKKKRKRKKKKKKKKKKKNSMPSLQCEVLQTGRHHLFHHKRRLTNAPHHHLLLPRLHPALLRQSPRSRREVCHGSRQTSANDR